MLELTLLLSYRGFLKLILLVLVLGVGGFYHLMLDNVDGVGVCSFI